MFFVLFLLLGLGSAHAQHDNCCPPEDWEAEAIGLSNGQGDDSYYKVVHKDSWKKEAIAKHDRNGNWLYLWIKDYNDTVMKTYEFDMRNARNCIIRPLNQPFITRENCRAGYAPGGGNKQCHRLKQIGIEPWHHHVIHSSFEAFGFKVDTGMIRLGPNTCFPLFQRMYQFQSSFSIILFYFNRTELQSRRMMNVPRWCFPAQDE